MKVMPVKTRLGAAQPSQGKGNHEHVLLKLVEGKKKWSALKWFYAPRSRGKTMPVERKERKTTDFWEGLKKECC